MTCKKKKTPKKTNASVITAPCANDPVQVLLATGTPRPGPALLRGTRAGAPAAGISREGRRARARLPSLLAACLCPQPSAARAPRETPTLAARARLQTSPPAPATRGAGEQEARRSLPSRPRQPTTPQKKTAFPSVPLQANGRRGPGRRSHPENPKRDHRYPGPESPGQAAASRAGPRWSK